MKEMKSTDDGFMKKAGEILVADGEDKDYIDDGDVLYRNEPILEMAA